MATDNYDRARNWVQALERALLGAAIVDPTGYTASDLTTAFPVQWFQDSLHRAVFQAICALVARGARDLDVGLVVAELQHQGTYAEFANAAHYVCQLTEGVVPPPTQASRLFRLQEMRRAWCELGAAKADARG